MPDLIVIRLYPPEPTTADDFRNNYLDKLTITAFDISFSNLKGEQIGQPARYLPSNLPNSRIAQNFTYEPASPILIKWHAVATAVIEVSPNRIEYDQVDLRLTIERDGEKIINRSTYYDIPTVSKNEVPVPIDPNTTISPDTYAIDPVSLYLTLPASRAALDPAIAQLNLPMDGTPPNFDDLKQAVIKVLQKDPAISNADLDRRIAELKLEQCRHIAYEIIWGQQVDSPPQAPIDALGKMYTSPDQPRSDREQLKIDASRKKLEVDLIGYYTTRNSEAERLTAYIFALGAAINCQQRAEQSRRVGFEFPIIPTTTNNISKIQKAKVVLFNP